VLLRIRQLNREIAQWPTSDNPTAVQESVVSLPCDAPMLSRAREPDKAWPDQLTCVEPITRTYVASESSAACPGIALGQALMGMTYDSTLMPWAFIVRGPKRTPQTRRVIPSSMWWHGGLAPLLMSHDLHLNRNELRALANSELAVCG
jgi:hypothetical protein